MQPSPDLIYHIATRKDWEPPGQTGSYRAIPLPARVSLHASTAAQVLQTANRYYRSQPGLVLLVIDTRHVGAEIRYEAPPGSEERFPHIYGALALEAVVRVIPSIPARMGPFLTALRTNPRNPFILFRVVQVVYLWFGKYFPSYPPSRESYQ